MSTVSVPEDLGVNPRVKAVLDEIKALRGVEDVNLVWKYLAFDAGLLENMWADVKETMGTESLLDPMTKELVYAAVSIANSCSYCVHSHTAAAKAKGLTEAQHAEFIRIVGTAAKTNHILNAMQISPDPMFDADAG